jgi:hypothetical protein
VAYRVLDSAIIMKPIANCLTLAALSLGLSTAVHAQNLVQNGSFETGNLNDWSVTNSNIGASVASIAVTTGATNGFTNIIPESGSYYAAFNNGFYSTLDQSIATTVGDSYDFSYYVNDLDGSHSSSQAGWNVYFGDQRDFAVNGPGSELAPNFSTTNYAGVNSRWTQVSFTFTADSTSTNLFFQGDPDSWDGNHTEAIDNISVTDLTHPGPSGGSSVPDGGATISILGMAFTGLAAFRRRFAKE